MAGCGLYLTDISTPLNRARTTAPLQMAVLIGFMMGPPVGGFLADAHGLQLPFYVTSGALLLTAASALMFLPETLRKSKTAKQGSTESGKLAGDAWNQWRTMLKKPDIQGISSVSLLAGFGQGSVAVTTIIYCAEILKMAPSEVGIMFTASVMAMVAVTKPATDFSDRFHNEGNSRSKLIVPGIGITALAACLQGLELFPSALPFSALFLTGGLAQAVLVTPNVTPFLIDATTEDERAQALAMRNMAQDVGTLGGAIALGAVSQTIGVPESILCSAGVHALTMVFFAMRTSSGRRQKAMGKDQGHEQDKPEKQS